MNINNANMAQNELEMLPIWKCLNGKDAELANKTSRATAFLATYLEGYKILFPKYTDHSITHSLNVLRNMTKLMRGAEMNGYTELDKYTAYDLFFCIYVALFHDVGMVFTEEERKNELSGASEKYIAKDYGCTSDSEVKFKEREAFLQNKIRAEHGNRVKDILTAWATNNSDLFSVGNAIIVKSISDICKSHMQSAKEVERLKVEDNIASTKYHPAFVAVLLRLADAFDFSPDRAPRMAYKNNDVGSDKTSETHYAKNQGVVSSFEIEPDKNSSQILVTINPTELDDWLIENQAKSEDDYYKVQADIYQYYFWTKEEVEESCEILDKIYTNKEYQLNIKMRRSPNPNKFDGYIPNYKIKMNYETIVANLLGTGLYGEPKVGLREIVQNSIDACRWLSVKGMYEHGTNPSIEIAIDEAKNEVRVTDNGIGMTMDTVKNCFLGIGNSIYNKSDYLLDKEQFEHIGRHGIGFFATFMLSDDVKIKTCHYLNAAEKIEVRITSRQDNAFIRTIKSELTRVGTQIILRDIAKFKNIFKPLLEEKTVTHAVRHYLENLFLNDNSEIEFRVKLIDSQGNELENLKCDIFKLEEKVKSEEDSQVEPENLTEYFAPKTIECFARFDSEIRTRRLFVWDQKQTKFMEKTWNTLAEGEISICTVQQFGADSTNQQIVLYVPKDENDKTTVDPFGLVTSNYREKTYYETSRAFNDAPITLNEFCKTIGFKIEGFPIGAFAEKLTVKKMFGLTLLLRENSEFEDSAPKTKYVRSGKSYYEKIYARNVIIPNAHLVAPFMLVAVDGDFSGEVEDIIVNIMSDNIYPTLKRDNLSDEDIKRVSYAVARALMLRQICRRNISIDDAREIVKKFFKDKNIFSKEI